MDHTYAHHMKCLSELCRACGNRTLTIKDKQRNRRPIKCTDHRENILLTFNINVNEDKEMQHSPHLCLKCVKRMKNVNKRFSTTSIKCGRELEEASKHIWTEFDPALDTNECGACRHYARTSLGNINLRNITETTNKTEPVVSMSLNQLLLDPILLEETDITDIDTSTDTTHYVIQIPTDTPTYVTDTSIYTPRKPAPLLTTASCSPIIKRHNMFHLLLETPLTQPLTQQEQEVVTHLIRRKLQTEAVNNVIKCKTGGTPITLLKITQHRKQTSEVRTPTKRARSKSMEGVREVVSGPSSDSIEKQHAHELSRLPKKSKSSIFEKAGFKNKIVVSTELAVKMKENLNLTSRQERKHKALLNQAGVVLPSEVSERKFTKEITHGWVNVGMQDFVGEDGQGHVLETPFGYVKDLKGYVSALLNQYKNKGLLTWYDGSIPEDQVWVKIGGGPWER